MASDSSSQSSAPDEQQSTDQEKLHRWFDANITIIENSTAAEMAVLPRSPTLFLLDEAEDLIKRHAENVISNQNLIDEKTLLVLYRLISMLKTCGSIRVTFRKQPISTLDEWMTRLDSWVGAFERNAPTGILILDERVARLRYVLHSMKSARVCRRSPRIRGRGSNVTVQS